MYYIFFIGLLHIVFLRDKKLFYGRHKQFQNPIKTFFIDISIKTDKIIKLLVIEKNYKILIYKLLITKKESDKKGKKQFLNIFVYYYELIMLNICSMFQMFIHST